MLWLWCRLVATAPIGPLAWESPYATGAAQEMAKGQKKKKKKKKKEIINPHIYGELFNKGGKNIKWEKESLFYFT